MSKGNRMDDSVNAAKEVNDSPEDSRLAKRLCYLLRYGAVKEGLQVHEGGYVDLNEVLALNLMKHDTENEVITEINTSTSHRGAKRFETKTENKKTFIRACFCRNFELCPLHEGSKVHTLLDTCLNYVSSNLDMYDLQDFPDEFLINKMIHRLKRDKKLNNSTLRNLLVPAIEHLDLDNLYVTEGTLKVVWNCCPQLKVLSLKDCGYIMTDNLMEQLVKRLPNLESLNLCACKHLTDRSLKAICRRLKNLKQLNLSWIRTMTEEGKIEFVQECKSLEYLDIFDHRFTKEGVETLTQLAIDRNIKIVLKSLINSKVAPENPCALLPNFGMTFQ